MDYSEDPPPFCRSCVEWAQSYARLKAENAALRVEVETLRAEVADLRRPSPRGGWSE